MNAYVKLNKRKLNAMYYLAKVNPKKYYLKMIFGRVSLMGFYLLHLSCGTVTRAKEVESIVWSCP